VEASSTENETLSDEEWIRAKIKELEEKIMRKKCPECKTLIPMILDWDDQWNCSQCGYKSPKPRRRG